MILVVWPTSSYCVGLCGVPPLRAAVVQLLEPEPLLLDPVSEPRVSSCAATPAQHPGGRVDRVGWLAREERVCSPPRPSFFFARWGIVVISPQAS